MAGRAWESSRAKRVARQADPATLASYPSPWARYLPNPHSLLWRQVFLVAGLDIEELRNGDGVYFLENELRAYFLTPHFFAGFSVPLPLVGNVSPAGHPMILQVHHRV